MPLARLTAYGACNSDIGRAMLATVMPVDVYNDAHDVATYIIVSSVYNTVNMALYIG